MMTTNTPMAYRAANAITHIHRFQMHLSDRDEIAEIIDRETAAPEMLAALERVVKFFEDQKFDAPDDVKDAIRKARGGN